MKIKRFLGYTDSIKEPQKTRIEDILGKAYRYNGNIYSTVELLCVKLLEGCYPDKEENYQYYKRNGELSVPKTLYKFVNIDNSYMEVNKTEYNFICYLLEQGLNTEEKILEYDKADVERLEVEKRKQEKEEKIRIEKEREYQKEKERIEAMIQKEVQTLPTEEVMLLDDIFLHTLGIQPNKHVYKFLAYMHHFDNPICKSKIVSWLSNNANKASIKVFECLTGLKLPKTMKKRIVYLESITSADFKGMTEYKPRKKAVKKDIQLEEFYIIINNNSWEKVIAEPYSCYGIEFFIRNNNGKFSISLAKSGLLVVTGKNKTDCINKLTEYVSDYGKERFQHMVQSGTERIIGSAGINPRYKNI